MSNSMQATVTITESTIPLRGGVYTGETKSGRTRTISMPAFVVAELRQHRLIMAERLLALGTRLNGDHAVVAHEDGRPVNPMSLTAWCRRQFGKLHSLRHGHVSLLLGAGVAYCNARQCRRSRALIDPPEIAGRYHAGFAWRAVMNDKE
jgi:integrase